jgi:hypothetical protein
LVAPAVTEAAADTERVGGLPKPPLNAPWSHERLTQAARRLACVPPKRSQSFRRRGAGAGGARRILAAVAHPWSIQPSPKRLSARSAPAACPNRRGARSRLAATLSASHLATSLTLTAAGILIAGAPFIIQYRAAYLFLLASYGFYLIAWTQLHYVNVVFHISEHISRVIAPRIRMLLTKITPGTGETYPHLLSWEDAGRTSGFWSVPLQAARYLFPICAAWRFGDRVLCQRIAVEQHRMAALFAEARNHLDHCPARIHDLSDIEGSAVDPTL